MDFRRQFIYTEGMPDGPGGGGEQGGPPREHKPQIVYDKGGFIQQVISLFRHLAGINAEQVSKLTEEEKKQVTGQVRRGINSLQYRDLTDPVTGNDPPTSKN